MDDVVKENCVPQISQDARQLVHHQGLRSRCWSHHTASIVGSPKMPVGMVQENSCVGDELKNKRGVLTLWYPLSKKKKRLPGYLPRRLKKCFILRADTLS